MTDPFGENVDSCSFSSGMHKVHVVNVYIEAVLIGWPAMDVGWPVLPPYRGRTGHPHHV